MFSAQINRLKDNARKKIKINKRNLSNNMKKNILYNKDKKRENER